MSTTNTMAITITPEMALALEAGVKDALKTVMGKEDPRDKVAPCQTLSGVKIDMTLEIDTVSIGQDTDKAPTASIPLLPVLGLLVKRMGCTREAALKLLREVMTEALEADKKASESILAETGVEEVMEQVKSEVISKLPRTKVAKAVKAKGATLKITGVSQAK